MTEITIIPMNMILVFTVHMVFMIKSHSCSLCYVCNLNCRVYKSFLRSDFIRTKNRVDQNMIIIGNVY